MEKNETTYPKVVLCDTTYIPDYEEYKEYCEANGCEPQSEDSQDYWYYVSEICSMKYNDFISDMENSTQANKPCLLTGSCGLWNGRHEIIPYKFGDALSAVKRAYGSCDDLKVKQEDGIIKVEVLHHDGSNFFEIRPLTEYGKKMLKDDYDDEPISYEVTDGMVGKYEGYLF